MTWEETNEGGLSLETERLVIATPRESDLDEIVRLADNRAIAENLATMPHPFAAADAQRWIMQAGLGVRSAKFAIYDKRKPERFIGAAGFGNREDELIEIGCWIGQPYWERGFATEAVRAVIDFAFQAHDFECLHSACRVTNEAARRVLIRCGFQYHKSGMTPSTALSGTVAIDRYRLERSTWTSLRGWRSAAIRRPISPPPGTKVA